jgi:competence protein ComEC
MHTRSAKLFLLLLPLAAAAVLTALFWATRPQPRTDRSAAVLRATFLDVGQGDACVLEGPTGRVVVVDGGGRPGTDERGGGDPGSRVVVPYLRHRGISTVDLVVPTHADDDHAQGLVAVVERLRVVAALDGGFGGTSPPYARLRDALRRRNIPVWRARRGQTVDLGGGARLEVLHPGDDRVRGGVSSSNSHSVVLRVVYGRAALLLTGDIDAAAETDLVASGRPLSADVLKAAHHGSRGSSSDAFLRRVAPRFVVVSCGRGNVFGHPHAEALRGFARCGARVFRTDRDGAVTVTTDGTRLRITPTLTATK